MTTLSVSVPRSARDEPTGVGWSLLALAWALPWLVGFHGPPWTAFYNDWLMASGAIPLAAWVVWQQRGTPWGLDRLALAVLLLAAVPLLQAATGKLLFPHDGVIVALQLAGLAAVVSAAHQAEGHAPERTGDTLFAGILCAAVVSAGLALYQRFELSYLGVLVEPLPGSNRVIANVGQPNNLATLLNWGLLALWWGFDRRRIGPAVAIACACLLLLGVVATQSRTGIASALLLAAMTLVFRRLEGRRVSPAVVACLAAYFVCLVALWPLLAQDLMPGKGLTLADQASVGRRPEIWVHAIRSILAQPWLGYGWNQGAIAQQSIALQQPPLHLLITYAHSLVLDLMVWNGVPIGALCLVALVAWFVLRARELRRQRDAVAWLMPTVLLLHAMVELPHAHMMFLVPAAISMGLLNQRVGAAPVVRIRLGAAGAVLIALVVAAAVVFVDYRKVESDLMAQRVRAARIGDLTPTSMPTIWILGPLEGVLVALRTEPRTGMGETALAELRRTAARYPSAPSLFRYARAAALNGDPHEAERAMATLCSVQPNLVCQQARAAWQAIAEATPLLQRAEIPAAQQ